MKKKAKGKEKRLSDYNNVADSIPVFFDSTMKSARAAYFSRWDAYCQAAFTAVE